MRSRMAIPNRVCSLRRTLLEWVVALAAVETGKLRPGVAGVGVRGAAAAAKVVAAATATAGGWALPEGRAARAASWAAVALRDIPMCLCP